MYYCDVVVRQVARARRGLQLGGAWRYLTRSTGAAEETHGCGGRDQCQVFVAGGRLSITWANFVQLLVPFFAPHSFINIGKIYVIRIDLEYCTLMHVLFI